MQENTASDASSYIRNGTFHPPPSPPRRPTSTSRPCTTTSQPPVAVVVHAVEVVVVRLVAVVHGVVRVYVVVTVVVPRGVVGVRVVVRGVVVVPRGVVVRHRVVVSAVIRLVVRPAVVLLVVACVVGSGVPAFLITPAAAVVPVPLIVPSIVVLLLSLLADVVVVPGQVPFGINLGTHLFIDPLFKRIRARPSILGIRSSRVTRRSRPMGLARDGGVPAKLRPILAQPRSVVDPVARPDVLSLDHHHTVIHNRAVSRPLVNRFLKIGSEKE